MARKPRIQFAGAHYHVINRGNYRSDLFETAGAAAAFEQCLFEVCEQAGWRLHAFSLMRNHFHLALETPRGNLVEGMHWLQSTFAVRFNKFRSERGHLFQGRYQAILVEPGPRFAQVVSYVHLNPVRAGIVPIGQLAQFRWSSYRRFLKGDRPPSLVCDRWLADVDELTDTPEGWQRYQTYLAWLAADEGEQKKLKFEELSHGWAIGSDEWRKALAKAHAAELAAQKPAGRDIGELKEAVWARALAELLQREGKTQAEAAADWYSAEWKIKLAIELRKTTTATNAWIARELSMGSSGSSVSVYVSRWKANKPKMQ
ncbi:MAG: transposase [Verrucomicrobia bacterium]|nr:transposase [Verrucomicrobiota bacterium]